LGSLRNTTGKTQILRGYRDGTVISNRDRGAKTSPEGVGKVLKGLGVQEGSIKEVGDFGKIMSNTLLAGKLFFLDSLQDIQLVKDYNTLIYYLFFTLIKKILLFP